MYWLVAYDLYLTRTIKNATLVRAATGGGRAMTDAAGVRQPLVAYARTDPNVRVLVAIEGGGRERGDAEPVSSHTTLLPPLL